MIEARCAQPHDVEHSRCLQVISHFFLSLHLPGVAVLATLASVFPIVATVAHQRGYSDAATGFIIASAGAGRVAAVLPTAYMYPTVGLVHAQTYGLFVALLGITLGTVLFATEAGVCIGVCVLACGVGAYAGARAPIIYAMAPSGSMGTMNSVAGGVARWAQVLGPIMSSAVMQWYDPRVAFAANASLIFLALLSMYVSRRDLEDGERSAIARDTASGATSSLREACEVLGQSRHRVASLAATALMMGALRGSRSMIIPVVAIRLNLPPLDVGALIGASYVVDALLFWLSGWLMDAMGRRWAIVPSFLVYASAFVLLAKSVSVSDVYVAVLLMGFAESLSCGCITTLTADIIPSEAGTPAYIILRALPDGATLVGPLVLGAMLYHSSLAATCYSFAALGLLAAAYASRSPLLGPNS